ncbi:MAG TPA: DUF2922 domain-containing protein [Clostridia bacterium]|jgi:uncharacterized protein YceH (UPF0502 family)|nr:DUF2922 domain-containing protein [Clostridia bacterium]
MSVTLQLVFRTAGGSRRTISVQDPKEDLTDAQVQEAMDTILSKNIFTTSDGDYVSILEARKVTTEVSEFDVS